jgi:hypothetical protein
MQLQCSVTKLLQAQQRCSNLADEVDSLVKFVRAALMSHRKPYTLVFCALLQISACGLPIIHCAVPAPVLISPLCAKGHPKQEIRDPGQK